MFNSQIRFTITFLVFFLTLYSYALVNGYPTFFRDTFRYVDGINLKHNEFSPLFVSLLIKPFFSMSGFWGWYFFNLLIASFTLAYFKMKAFNKVPLYIFLLGLLISMYGFVVLCLIMDFYTTVGLLCLFLLIFYRNHFIVPVIFTISTCAHYGNLLLFTAVAFIVCLFYKKSKPFLFIITLILISIFLNISHYFFTARQFHLLPTSTNVFISSRIMHDIPESILGYSRVNKNSIISKNSSVLYKLAKASSSITTIVWGDGSPIEKNLSQFNKEAPDYIFYTIIHYPKENLIAIAGNSFRLLLAHHYPLEITPDKDMKLFYDLVALYDKNNLDLFTNSLFYKRILENLATPNFSRIIFIICLYFNLAILFIYRKNKDTNFYQFILFSTVSIFISVLIMSNLSGLFWRFLVRSSLVVFLSSFAGLYLLSKEKI